MGFLRRLLGAPSPVAREYPAWLLAPDRDDAVLQVVGEGSYQDALSALGGRRTTEGPTNTDFVAGLIREANNRYDENAIQVQIDGRRVGYLSREDAIRYRPVVEWAMARARNPKVVLNRIASAIWLEPPSTTGLDWASTGESAAPVAPASTATTATSPRLLFGVDNIGHASTRYAGCLLPHGYDSGLAFCNQQASRPASDGRPALGQILLPAVKD